jgi:ATP/maltotriose-dependent transcriptional regulator MalT
LLALLLRASARRDRFVALLRRVGDEDLAELVGQPVYAEGDPRLRLTPRERDVYGLVIEGMSNREIGRLLFIEESTVKVHVHHIYDKLGVRSRLTLMMQAKLDEQVRLHPR